LPGVVHVVDDDHSFQTAIRRRLQLAGYEVQIYSSAEQFLDQQPNDNRSGCLLLDVRIPGLSGPELQGRLREVGSTLPIVFISAYEDIQTAVQTIRAGAEDFLIKPVASDLLLPTIDRAIARHDALRKLRSELDVLLAHVATLTPRERQVFRTGGSRQNQQTDCVCAGLDRTDDQGAPTTGHGENERTIVGRTGPDRCAAGPFAGGGHARFVHQR
jgi:FixJ family two-component response regulator